MKARVIADKCVGCGLCAETCPEVFAMNSDTNVATAIPGAVPATAEQKAREAAADCPTEAITIEQ